MIKYKTESEIEIMKVGGKKLVAVFDEIESKLKPGMTTRDVDTIAESTIIKLGGTPSFKRVPGYTDTICISINDQVVHTRPSSQVINEGDVVTVDVGMFYNGFNTDKAITYYLTDKKDPEVVRFLDSGVKALNDAIKVAINGNYIGDISSSIDKEIRSNGYHIVKELTGHGVGEILHEDPPIPGYLHTKREKTNRIKTGMTLAIEVIYATKTSKIKNEKGDEWSLVTVDGSLSACFEHTIAVLEHTTLILA